MNTIKGIAITAIVIATVMCLASPAVTAADGTDTTTETVATVGNENFTTLQAAFNYIQNDSTPTGDYTVEILQDIAEEATILQMEGKNVTVDGNGNTMTATLTINGNNRYEGEEKLTIKEMNFSSTSGDCISGPNKIDNVANRYAHNVTVSNCGFDLESKVDSVAIRFEQANDIVITDCTSSGGHSFCQVESKGLEIRNVTSTDSKNGISINRSSDVEISTVTVTASEYGIRGEYSANNSVVTITDADITAAQPIVIRKVDDSQTYTYSLDVSNSTLIPTGEYEAITVTTGSDMTTVVPPTGNTVTVETDAIVSAPTVLASADKKTATIGDSVTLTATMDDLDPDGTAQYVWTLDGETVGNAAEITLEMDAAGTHKYTVTVSGTSYSKEYTAIGEVTITVTAPTAETVTVTFVDIDGTTLKQVDIPKGSSVPAEEIPAFGTAPENYAYHWNSEDEVDVYPDYDAFFENTTLTAALHIESFEITVEISGDTATAVVDAPVDGCTVNGYLWAYMEDESLIGTSASVTLDRDGWYLVRVEIEDSNGIVGYGGGYFEYTAETDLPPFIPFPPEQGGDPVEVYPSGDSGSSDNGDDSMKVVAVAAAAVIAAILAIVLASTYRKD